MRLPGTRYQEPGWEQVRKLLGQCSLAALAAFGPGRLAGPHDPLDSLAAYVDLAGRALRGCAATARAQAAGNSYGDTVHELALGLLYELQARPDDWRGFCAAVAAQAAREGPFWDSAGGQALLRKKANDMFTQLRDRVDADNYMAACGRPCSANRMYAYRMLDSARAEVARLFSGWREHRAQVGAILGRPLDAEPIEARQLRAGGPCKPEWIMRWSETLERFGAGPGPLHTRSKRFASLKDQPEKIGAMLREIAEYEALSANSDQDWRLDAGQALDWLDDYQRVLAESHEAAAPGPDRILERLEEEQAEDAPDGGGDDPAPLAPLPLPAALALAPGYAQAAACAHQRAVRLGRVLGGATLGVRLAVYLKLLGPHDDSYPADWLDPATGELPTLQQLAALDGVSLPTLRKRRDAAIERLMENAHEHDRA